MRFPIARARGQFRAVPNRVVTAKCLSDTFHRCLPVQTLEKTRSSVVPWMGDHWVVFAKGNCSIFSFISEPTQLCGLASEARNPTQHCPDRYAVRESGTSYLAMLTSVDYHSLAPKKLHGLDTNRKYFIDSNPIVIFTKHPSRSRLFCDRYDRHPK